MELAATDKGRMESPPVDFRKRVKRKGTRNNCAHFLHNSIVART